MRSVSSTAPAYVATLIGAARLPFLGLSITSLLLGVALASASGGRLDSLILALALLGGLLAHLGVNALNEYVDFRSGLDLRTRRTPFSGGSGALPRLPQAERGVLALGLAAVIGSALSGLCLAWIASPWLIPIGLAGLALVVGYSPWINRRPWLCLVAPGLGIGLLMVPGLVLALTGTLDRTSALLALVPFAMSNSVLLMNQLPDIEPDRSAGRRNLAILHGPHVAAAIASSFALLAAAAVLAAVCWARLPLAGLAAMAPIGLAGVAAHAAGRRVDDRPRLIPWLGLNVAAAHLAPLLLAAALLWG